jgi:hypothetical protein
MKIGFDLKIGYDRCCGSGSIGLKIGCKIDYEFSVADSDPGSGVFLTPGPGMNKKTGSGCGMNRSDYISVSL